MHNKTKTPSFVYGIAVVVTIICLLVFLANKLVFEVITEIFNPLGGQSNFLIGSLLGGLSGLFIVMIIVEKYFYNKLTKFLYYISAVWMGMFAYIFLVSLVYKYTNNFVSNPQFLGLMLFSIALLVSIYGIIHGREIVIKKISVSLNNLPESWKDKTAVWISDLHLGSINGVSFAQKVTTLCNSLSPGILFIGGDLYDGTHAPDPHVLAKPLAQLSAKHGVFYVTGNHEEFGDPSHFVQAIQDIGITVLNDECVSINGLQIIGVDYTTTFKREDFSKVLESINYNKNAPSILLKHEPKNLDVSELSGVSLQISGHTHKGQQWPFNYIARLAYKGFEYGLKNHGLLQVLTSSGVGHWGPPIRVGSDCEIIQITFK